MGRRLAAIIIKEFVQLARDRRTLAMALLMPVIQLLLFGYAITTEVEHLPTVVFDQSQSQESRALLQRFVNSRFFHITAYAANLQEVQARIDGGSARVGIVIPPDLAQALQAGRPARVQVIVDASDPLVARSALSTAEAIGQVASLEIATRLLSRAGVPVRGTPLEVRTRAWYNPDLRSVNFMVPGLLAVILSMLTLMLTAIAIVRERELGTLEQLVATPIRRAELMLGKILPYVVLGYLDITLALLIGAYWFRVPIRGSLLLLYALALVFYLTTLGQGILVSTVSRTQRQAMQAAFFVFLPTVLLSGFMFPREGMPPVIQWIGYAIPLTYFLIIVRGIILKGIGLAELGSQIVPLAILGMVFFTASVLRFQKRLE
ncbi:MAG: ABC transporter permease [Armatimonadota bacterium]|nr:ABC transporter permease [Armatimonadota bacterium]MDR7426995.1 ABC transporter permease [Armatimonadota bacterium]MDR7463087.1 ABC transporter permease [Armatimonadota bacterium]MDR7469330.1 ABC transporter permease [Armatimonadota bacterium]MDR7539244.1 ABC transporter permease [Armatimonadota bacterium]